MYGHFEERDKNKLLILLDHQNLIASNFQFNQFLISCSAPRLINKYKN